jgi:hypothetical protein
MHSKLLLYSSSLGYGLAPGYGAPVPGTPVATATAGIPVRESVVETVVPAQVPVGSNVGLGLSVPALAPVGPAVPAYGGVVEVETPMGVANAGHYEIYQYGRVKEESQFQCR